MGGLRRYPFELFVAFLVFMLGLYGLINPYWPPIGSQPWEIVVMNTEALYFLISGAAVISTFFSRNKWPIESIVVQMFGWLFIGFAGVMALLIKLFIPQSQLIHTDTTLGYVVSGVLWISLVTASFVKYFDIRVWYRSGGHKSE